MSDLQLDFGAFGTLIETLSGAADSIRDATARLEQASKSDLGTHSLDNAAARFQQRWHDGIDKIAKAAGEMTSGLQETRKAYAAAEENNSNTLRAAGAGLSAHSASAGQPATGNSLDIPTSSLDIPTSATGHGGGSW